MGWQCLLQTSFHIKQQNIALKTYDSIILSLCHNGPLLITVLHLFSVWILARNGWHMQIISFE